MKLKGLNITNYLTLVLMHLGLGFVIYLFPGLSKFFLLGVVVIFLFWVIKTGNRRDEVLLAAAYITGIEVFSRMTGGALTYEFAKYAVIMFLTIGMFYKGFKRNSWIYVLFLILLVPGILFSAINLNYGSNIANAIGFNLSGPVCLGIAALYCYDRKIPYPRLQRILIAVLLPVISMTTYLYLYTPNIQDVITGTESNFAASGGYGPNQVSTILGLGAFILFSRLFIIRDRFINMVDLSLLGFIIYRAIVTFSRGGVITAAVCAAIFVFFFYTASSARSRARAFPKIVIILVVLFATWGISSLTTSGLIDKRYANQDAAGREKEDLTTGRVDIFNEELKAFYEHPLTGIGIGKAKERRLANTGEYAASHNEVSRMLSEHGILGLIGLLLLLLTPVIFRLTNKTNIFLFSFVAFWFLTINHSAMRIAAPAFIYGLALLNLNYAKEKRTLYR